MAAFGGTGGSTGGFQGGDFVGQLLQMLGGMTGGMGQQYQNFIKNPTASPLYQNQLSGLLASMEGSKDQARTGLLDMLRSAGNMSSGNAGIQSARLEGNLQQNDQIAASQLLGQMFPQMIQALLGPMQISSGLVGALKNPAPSSGGSTSGGGWGSIPPSMGNEGWDPQLVNQGSWNQHYA